MREIPKNRLCALILKEGKLGAINGAIIGAVTALVAWVWKGSPYLGLVIGLGMIVNLIFAGLSGAAIPLSMKKIGIDPAQSSSIILTTVTDIIGFLAFLGFAVIFQSYLV
jgi:magnesium transporter